LSESTWGSYDANIYYNPEKLGYKLIGVLEDADADYSFDTLIVVQDKATGTLFAAHDTGCSCPTPFEEIRGPGDMQPIRTSQDLAVYIAMNDSTYSEKWSLSDRLAIYRKIDKINAEKRQAEIRERNQRVDKINHTNTPLIVSIQPLGSGGIR
jgi:hypothetical protein